MVSEDSCGAVTIFTGPFNEPKACSVTCALMSAAMLQRGFSTHPPPPTDPSFSTPLNDRLQNLTARSSSEQSPNHLNSFPFSNFSQILLFNKPAASIALWTIIPIATIVTSPLHGPYWPPLRDGINNLEPSGTSPYSSTG